MEEEMNGVYVETRNSYKTSVKKVKTTWKTLE
jgi:hypothetical protein